MSTISTQLVIFASCADELGIEHVIWVCSQIVNENMSWLMTSGTTEMLLKAGAAAALVP